MTAVMTVTNTLTPMPPDDGDWVIRLDGAKTSRALGLLRAAFALLGTAVSVRRERQL